MKRIDKFLERVPEKDRIMMPHWTKYAMDRVRWKKQDGSFTDDYEIKNAVQKFIVHNGEFGSGIEEKYRNLEELDLMLGRERVFLEQKKGIIHIAQPTSKARGERFEDAIYTGCVLSCDGWDVSLESFNMEKEERQHTLRNYRNFAYDFVRDVSISNSRLDGIDYVAIGPLDWFRRNSHAEIVKEKSHKYLDYMVTEIEGKKVLNLDYVYSDQAKEIIDHLLFTYHGETPDDNYGGRKIHILMYGKVGGIRRQKQEINGIVTPNGIISDYDVERGSNALTRLENVFCSDKKKPDYILNSVSVPLQRRSTLAKGMERGCSIIEMEVCYSIPVINMAKEQYHNLEINHGFAGFISDLPFEGTTLAHDLDHEPGRKRCVEIVADYIKNS